MRADFIVGNTRVPAGERSLVQLPIAGFNLGEPATLPVHVLHSKHEGPTLFISAAVHGDELNGVEIVRRVLGRGRWKKLKGTLVAVPVVNVYGIVRASRYLPDRRDLNRNFPGSERGSLAARLAYVFTHEIVRRCSHGVDLHTGAIHRANLPQIRANLADPETERLARAFGVPVVLNSLVRDGSLRQCAAELGIPILLYEAGEALRYDEVAIRAGVQGVLGVMRELGMLPSQPPKPKKVDPFVANQTTWVRAPVTGMLRALVPLGTSVAEGELLAHVDNPYGGEQTSVTARVAGVVIGRAQCPLVHEGDAVYHIAHFRDDSDAVEEEVSLFREEFEVSSYSTEPEIV